jgi:hypothetical protein
MMRNVPSGRSKTTSERRILCGDLPVIHFSSQGTNRDCFVKCFLMAEYLLPVVTSHEHMHENGRQKWGVDVQRKNLWIPSSKRRVVGTEPCQSTLRCRHPVVAGEINTT